MIRDGHNNYGNVYLFPLHSAALGSAASMKDTDPRLDEGWIDTHHIYSAEWPSSISEM